MRTTVSRVASIVAATAALAAAAATPTVVQATPPGAQQFAATGSAQSFTVPTGVTTVVVDLFGAAGGTSAVQVPPADALGGESSASLDTTPGGALQVMVGGHGLDGSSNGAGAGGFNGGGDGGSDVDGCCPGGAGGGGASDVRSGACAATLSCGASARQVVAGGGGGAGGGANAGEPGGNGGGAAGAAGTDATDDNGTATAGGGGTASDPGAAGTGSAVGTDGDAGTVGDGGGGGDVGGGGGGGWHGGGGGAATSAPDGAGGGGGSGHVPSSGITTAGVRSGDGAAGIYWLTWSPSKPVTGESETLTSHLPPSAAGGTETFTAGSTTLCSDVAVGEDGTATCTVVLPPGATSVTATYTSPTPVVARVHHVRASVQYQGLSQTSSVTVGPAPTTTTVTANPPTSAFGQPVTFDATVVPNAPGTGAPDGTITFSSGGITLCSAVPVSKGTNQSTASCTSSALPVGTDTVTAAYSGSASYQASSGTTTETVSPAQVITPPAAGAGPGAPPWGAALLGSLGLGGAGAAALRRGRRRRIG